MLKTICDRCDVEVAEQARGEDPRVGIFRVKLDIMGMDGDGLREMHLCGPCYRAFLDWLATTPEEPVTHGRFQ